MYQPNERVEIEVKIKIYVATNDEHAINTVIEEIRQLFIGRCDASRILRSEGQGLHAFLTVYLGERR